MSKFILKQAALALIAVICGAVITGQSPAPGRVVDIGGYKLHLACAGRGSPTVILLNGLGEYSNSWALVQPQLARKTRTCAYDRAGQAWSDPGPRPRGIATSARELHALLQRAHLSGPYVLVGHSLGGMIARVYSDRYRDCAGIVFVDSAHEDEYVWINGRVVRPLLMPEWQWSALLHPQLHPDSSAKLTIHHTAPSKVLLQSHALPIGAQGPQDRIVPPPLTQAQVMGGDGFDLRNDFIVAHRINDGKKHPLGNMPLIVLSKTPGIDDDTQDYTQRQLMWNRSLQAQLATLSTNSKWITAEHSGHNIQIDDPGLVIQAVLQILDALKR